MGKQNPQEKRYLNSTNQYVNVIQSYWCRKILWPWNSELQDQSVFLNQGRFLADSTNIFLGLWDSLEGLDAGCPGCSKALLGCGNVAEGCPGCGIKTVERLEEHRAWSSCNVMQQSQAGTGMGEQGEGRPFHGREDASTSQWHIFGSDTSTESKMLFNWGALKNGFSLIKWWLIFIILLCDHHSKKLHLYVGLLSLLKILLVQKDLIDDQIFVTKSHFCLCAEKRKASLLREKGNKRKHNSWAVISDIHVMQCMSLCDIYVKEKEKHRLKKVTGVLQAWSHLQAAQSLQFINRFCSHPLHSQT